LTSKSKEFQNVGGGDQEPAKDLYRCPEIQDMICEIPQEEVRWWQAE